MEWGPGKLLYIHIADKASENMKELSEAELIFASSFKISVTNNAFANY